jgi:hypothetical protein
LAEAGFACPQDGQARGNGVPHSEQNFAVSDMLALQLGHFIDAPTTASLSTGCNSTAAFSSDHFSRVVVGPAVRPLGSRVSDSGRRRLKTAKPLGFEVPQTTRPRRRGDRIISPMSAFGTKRTCSLRRSMSAFGGKADIA